MTCKKSQLKILAHKGWILKGMQQPLSWAKSGSELKWVWGYGLANGNILKMPWAVPHEVAAEVSEYEPVTPFFSWHDVM